MQLYVWLNIIVQWHRMLVLHISKRNYAIVVYLEPGLQSVRALGCHHCGLSLLVLYSDPRYFSQIIQFCPLTKINSSFDVILPALGWIVVCSTNWALELGLKGHNVMHSSWTPVGWKHLTKSLKIKTHSEISFTRTLWVHWIQFLSSVAQDGKGLKPEKNPRKF